ncbi:MAG: phosphatase PAP2 family protein [Actinobacteria bacterium]|nr:phosphatase PAP2 family protein [Actinomycetota bacterium]
MPSPRGRLSAGARSALRGLAQVLRGTTTSWWRELLLIGVLYGIYEVSRGVGDVDVSSALANGREILHLERVWHISPEHVLNEALSNVTFIAVVASYFYSVMHYIVTPIVLVWMYRSHREHYGRARTALAISTGLGLVGYLLLPTAPPRMLAGSGLRDTLADTQNWGWWGGDGSVPRGLGALTNQFAAMPSLHVGWALWCGVLIAVYARRRWVRVLGVAYPIATTLVVLATGNHYLLDALAGCVTMGAGALLAAAIGGHPDPGPGAAEIGKVSVPATPRELVDLTEPAGATVGAE